VRVALIATLLLVVTTAVASSAQSPFTMLETLENGAVIVTSPNSSSSLKIAQGDNPSWSPDGTHVALREPSPSLSGSSGDVWVVPVGDPNDQARRLTFSGGVFGPPTWSPDGTSVAYLREVVRDSNDWDVWVVPAAGGDPRRVTATRGRKENLAWAPVGKWLLYARFPQPSPTAVPHVTVTDATTGATRTLAAGVAPVWSPDGSQIAFLASGDHVAVMAADGSAPHELTSLRSMGSGDPAWSPDGRQVVFGAASPTKPSNALPTRALPFRRDLWAAPADASVPPRVLNGGFALNAFGSGGGSSPSFTPDGTQIYYHGGGDDIWRMNPDGTCRQPVSQTPIHVIQGPYFAPGASGGEVTTCIDLATWVADPQAVTGVGIGSPMMVTVENHGTVSAPAVVVHVGSAKGVRFSGCDPVAGCALGDIPAGSSRTIELTASYSTTGAQTLAFTGASTEPNVRLVDPLEQWIRVFACSVAGTPRSDRLVGTPGSEGICGRDGNDRIEGRANGDYLNGGSGNDVILGGLGRDTILGGSGNDMVYAHEGINDWIDCGSGIDVVDVDQYDTVVNCERVRRT
jgi:Tol biopolymer transport system component